MGRVHELPAAARNAEMLNLLQDLHSTLVSNPHLEALLKELAFVPTAGGQLAAPRQLYDPRNDQLQALLDPSKSFPAAPFDSEEVRQALIPADLLNARCHSCILHWRLRCLLLVDLLAELGRVCPVHTYRQLQQGTQLSRCMAEQW